MADYSEKRAATLERIAKLETDQKAFADKPEKAARARVKLQQAKEVLGRIEAKLAANGEPKAVKATPRKRAKK